MIRIPDNCRAVGGRPIEEAYRNLVAFFDGLAPPLAGAGVRVRDEWDSVRYYAPGRRPHYPVKFQVRVSGDEALVSPGTVNRETPRMGIDRLDLLRYDLKGARQPTRPRLRLMDKGETDSEQGPGEDGRSFVCVRILVDPETGEVAKDTRPEDWLLVVHRSTLPPGFESGAMPETMLDDLSVCHWPLAVLYWSPDRKRVAHTQNTVSFDLVHTYYPPLEEGGRGAHVCY